MTHQRVFNTWTFCYWIPFSSLLSSPSSLSKCNVIEKKRVVIGLGSKSHKSFWKNLVEAVNCLVFLMFCHHFMIQASFFFFTTTKPFTLTLLFRLQEVIAINVVSKMICLKSSTFFHHFDSAEPVVYNRKKSSLLLNRHQQFSVQTETTGS